MNTDKSQPRPSPDRIKHSAKHADYSHPGLPQIDSEMLLGKRNSMLIRHGDKRYVLRQTRRGKLILTGHED
jgi:hemin uptake protein HemP